MGNLPLSELFRKPKPDIRRSMAFGAQAGAGVAIIAPAGPVDPSAFHAGLTLIEERYRVVRGADPDAPRHPGLPYLMGTDAERATALNAALSDPRVEAIFCARGGYGTMRILDRVDTRALCRRRVPIVGFSDCTALLLLAAGLGVPSVHGPVVTQLARLPAQDRAALFDLLEGRLPRLAGLRQIVGGRASGPLLGGNLSVLTRLIGTPHLPDLRGAILLLEEVNEAPYRLDRELSHLHLAGLLDRVAGVVVGQLHRCDAPQGHPPAMTRAEDVLFERLSGLRIPVVRGAPVGHGDRNMALPLGLEVTLDADNGTLVFRTP